MSFVVELSDELYKQMNTNIVEISVEKKSDENDSSDLNTSPPPIIKLVNQNIVSSSSNGLIISISNAVEDFY
jgi:hypothetical protein